MDGFNTTLNQGGNGGGGGAAAKLAVSTTYAALKDLRDGHNLVPGTWYRITDYACTTTQKGTQSANHAFDIIVRADDESHLNENAYAAHHEGDTYFQNCKLEAWQLKYCLDNDTNRFAWADSEDGKGVIFYMKDEWNNECPYDFKNIMFKRFRADDVTSDGHLSSLDGKYVGFDGDESPEGMEVDDTDSIWCYTFSALDLDGEVVDASLNTLNFDDNGYAPNYCYSNVIKECQMAQVIDDEQNVANKLNNIVFINDGVEEGRYSAMSQPLGNELDVDNKDITFLNNALYNKIGKNCIKLTFGNSCSYNTFGNDCYSNSFGNYCRYNTFGNYYSRNSFGNSCWNNSFGNNCTNNTFGNNCTNNTFGNSCSYNTFGNSCSYNTFGNDCYSNSFGNSCSYNTFGNNSYSNSFGNYCQNITVFDGVQYCSVTGGSSSAPVKNAQILNGTAGASQQNKLTIGFGANKAYTQVAAKTTTGVLKIFNPADLVQ